MLLETAVVFISWEPALVLFEDGGQQGGCWPPCTSSSLQSHTWGKQTFCCSPSACFFFFFPLHERKIHKINAFAAGGFGCSSDPMQKSAVTTGQPEPSPPAPTLAVEFPPAQQHQCEGKWGKPPPLGKHGLLRKRRHLPGEVLLLQGCYPKHSPNGSSEKESTKLSPLDCQWKGRHLL